MRTVPISGTTQPGQTAAKQAQIRSSLENTDNGGNLQQKTSSDEKFANPASNKNDSASESREPIPMGPPPKSNVEKSPVQQKQSHKSIDDHREVAARKKIAEVLQGIEDLEAEVNSFSGTKEDKTFIRLEHELTNKLLRLDTVSAAGSPGEDDIRSKRKAAIKRVQQTLDILELKVMF